MKHYLIIAIDVANTAPGIVFKTLIRSLEDSCRITLLAKRAEENLLGENVTYIPLHGGVVPWHRARKYWKLFGFNPVDALWSRRIWRKHRKEISANKYDAVITLTSNGYYSSLNLGKIISGKLGCRYVIYSVDGMPSPLPWLGKKDASLHGVISRELENLCDCASKFACSNPQMTAYQQGILRGFKGTWDYLYTPYRPVPQSFERKAHKGYNILYAGSLYGLRKIDGLVSAFEQFLKERPDANLYFVGEVFHEYKKAASEHIIFKDPTDRIDEYYAVADCLIDIAADIPDDVFLSSKVICYLPYKIPVLAISGKNSPVSQIMGGVPSIAQCGNDSGEILQALRKLQDVNDFSDRENLLRLFSPEAVCAKFKSILES